MDAPRNRKQRHAAAAPAQATSSDPAIPLATPPRDNPSKTTHERTLYDIIAERQNELLGNVAPSSARSGRPTQPKGTQFVTVDSSGQLVDTDGDIDSQVPANIRTERSPYSKQAQTTQQPDVIETDKPLPPFLDTILLSLPLTTLHFTLAYLAAHQYAESIDLPRLLRESATITFPLLTFLIHFAHGHVVSIPLPRQLSTVLASREPTALVPLTRDKFSLAFLRQLVFPPTLRTVIFLPVSAVLGAHLIAVTNGDPYYAVMKKAPAFGTMWIWCILEMAPGPAVLGALGPLVWGVWWMGYGIF